MRNIRLHRTDRSSEQTVDDAAERRIALGRPRGRLVGRGVFCGAAAAVVLVGLGVGSEIGSSASAAGLRHVGKTRVVSRHRAGKRIVRSGLVREPGTILHIALTGTETNAAGKTTGWSDQSWTRYRDSGDTAGGRFRQIVTQPGGADAETELANEASSHPKSELYDPSTNTIYTGTPALPAGVTLPVPEPGRRGPQTPSCTTLNTLAGLYLDSEVSAASGAPAAGVASVIAGDPFLGPDPIYSLLGPRSFVESAPLPWAPNAAEQLKLALSEHCDTVAGYRTIEGRKTVEIDPSGYSTWTYYADASTYDPVQLDLTAPNGASLKLQFQTYQQLPAQGNTSLLSLAAQHPTATIDNSPNHYQTAQTRLFPSQ